MYKRQGHPLRIGSPLSKTTTIGYTTPQSFEAAMDDAQPYPNINHLELNSSVLSSTNVSDTGVIRGLTHESLACATPTDAVINDYLNAGSKHVGANWQ